MAICLMAPPVSILAPSVDRLLSYGNAYCQLIALDDACILVLNSDFHLVQTLVVSSYLPSSNSNGELIIRSVSMSSDGNGYIACLVNDLILLFHPVASGPNGSMRFKFLVSLGNQSWSKVLCWSPNGSIN
jgi:hypothetical protein